MTTMAFGETTVTRIVEMEGPSFQADIFFPDFDREAVEPHLGWLVPDHYAPDLGFMVTSVHSWLLRTRHHTILIDACAGNQKNRPLSPRFHMLDRPYLPNLAAAGVAPEEIDYVVCTHLHVDHVGWFTRPEGGRWVPTFPNARHVFARSELERVTPKPDADGVLQDATGGVYTDSIGPVVEAGMIELFEGEHAVGDDLVLSPAPGHTAGHVLATLRGGGRAGVFIGDVLHSPVQGPFPKWNSAFCQLPDVARATRRRVLEHCCENGALLIAQHFAAPSVARVVRNGDGFGFRFGAG
jgi:glyoxylase-like metal-dependent hydrolase (beta-lactamase superfamily II)